jgi:hypothetical protein
VNWDKLNPDFYLANYVFFARIKLGAFIDVITTSIAANTHGKHHSDLDLLVLGSSDPG